LYLILSLSLSIISFGEFFMVWFIIKSV
jgi:hypothetical protein